MLGLILCISFIFYFNTERRFKMAFDDTFEQKQMLDKTLNKDSKANSNIEISIPKKKDSQKEYVKNYTMAFLPSVREEMNVLAKDFGYVSRNGRPNASALVSALIHDAYTKAHPNK